MSKQPRRPTMDAETARNPRPKPQGHDDGKRTAAQLVLAKAEKLRGEAHTDREDAIASTLEILHDIFQEVGL